MHWLVDNYSLLKNLVNQFFESLFSTASLNLQRSNYKIYLSLMADDCLKNTQHCIIKYQTALRQNSFKREKNEAGEWTWDKVLYAFYEIWNRIRIKFIWDFCITIGL